jgi:hypothetical protein
MPAQLTTTDDLFRRASLAPAELAAVAAAASGRAVRHARARAVPVDYDWGSPATAGLWRAEVRADTPAGPLDQVFFVKLLRHPRLWPQLGQLPDEAARQDFVAYFPWRFELDMHDCRIADVLPPGLRAPVLYRAKHVDADHVALWWEYVDQRPGPWTLADYHRAARLLGALAARRRAGAPANQRLPAVARRQRPGEALRYFVRRRVLDGCLPALADAGTWCHPVLAAALREVADPGLPADLAALGARLPALLDRLDRLPQCYAHGDASPQNLLIPAGGPAGLVVIDWGFGSPLPVGFDLGQLLVSLASAGQAGRPALTRIDPVIVDGYLAGLRDEGYAADPADVRAGYLGGLAARSALCLLPLERLAGAQPADDLAALFRHRLRLTREVLNLTSEAWAGERWNP